MQGGTLTAAAVTPFVWRLGRGDGSVVSDRFRLLPDGRIAGDHHSNESAWAIADGRLLVFAADGAVTTAFDEITGTGSEIRLRGRFWSLNESREVMHTLRPNLDDMHVEARLGDRDRPVFISFASHGKPYDPDRGTPRWEFFHLPIEERWNRIRIAERADPHFWYLNKTQRIVRALAASLGGTAGPVVMCGLSSGGFASMLYGELLTRACPDRAITTVSINPQTVHGASHRAFYERYVPLPMWPAMIEPDALAQRDIASAAIDALVVAPGVRGNIRHVVFYDELNLGELYQSAFIASRPGFTLRPRRLGLGPVEGIEHIFAGGAAHDAMRSAVRA